jgi:ribosomal protein S18 acetylase RimI-like enzyme
MSAVARITYFKRYRMELRLADIAPLEMPPGFLWIPWNRDLIDTHARVLYDSFHLEIDAKVFPSLGDLLGCHVLMQEICRKPFFIPEATWLIAAPDGTPVGTVQGLQEHGRGAIQNVGVVPEYRGRGIGSALLLQALHGFRRIGLGVGSLEVTDQNGGAIRLYRRHGFRKTRTLYKPVAADGFEIREVDDPRDWQEFDYD